MTDQRIFPFYVNGEFWMRSLVSETELLHGYSIRYISTKMPAVSCCINLKETSKMKMVNFQLAEIRQIKGDFLAEWFDGFWVVDDDLEMKDGEVYLKDKE